MTHRKTWALMEGGKNFNRYAKSAFDTDVIKQQLERMADFEIMIKRLTALVHAIVHMHVFRPA